MKLIDRIPPRLRSRKFLFTILGIIINVAGAGRIPPFAMTWINRILMMYVGTQGAIDLGSVLATVTGKEAQAALEELKKNPSLGS